MYGHVCWVSYFLIIVINNYMYGKIILECILKTLDRTLTEFIWSRVKLVNTVMKFRVPYLGIPYLSE
jgi:hypothetical protein